MWNRFRTLAACLFLLVAVQVVFSQTIYNDFVGYDDDDYVRTNSEVLQGLTGRGVVWAFTQRHSANWHPITWLSLMLDAQIFGPNAGGYHLTNMLLHAATAILLFSVLRRATDRFWPSLFAATLFAIHPLRVESVAWAAERKDILCGLFFMATLAVYIRYARAQRRRAVWYCATVVFFAFSLMSKPMAVTLPFVLLLLDYWPLGRNRLGERETGRLGGEKQRSVVGATSPSLQVSKSPSLSHLLLEKLPLFVLAAASCVVTVWAQTDSITSMERLWIVYRLENAAITYVAYMAKMLWPTNLIILYPYPKVPWPIGQVIAATAVLAALSGIVVLLRRRAPYALVGWFWYLGMLTPAIGIIQVGAQCMADRYTYLPQIGLSIIAAWGLADLCRWRPRLLWPCVAAAVAAVAILMARAYDQVGVWRDRESLWTHAIQCVPGHRIAGNNLGAIYMDRGENDRARKRFEENLKIDPDDVDANANLGLMASNAGNVEEAAAYLRRALAADPNHPNANNNMAGWLAKQNRLAEAETYCRRAIKTKPDFAGAHCNLGNILSQQGRLDEAVKCYQEALHLDPDAAPFHSNFGATLLRLGRFDEAVEQYRQAIKLDPEGADMQRGLADALTAAGHPAEAIKQYREAVRLAPGDVDSQRNLAWLLATADDASLRNGGEAVEIGQRLNRLTGGKRSDVLGTLAAAYAEAGRFPEAIATAKTALKLAQEGRLSHSADALRSQIALYEARKPYRQPPAAMP
jgi:tetratricopeptide (TPR) repeat protein